MLACDVTDQAAGATAPSAEAIERLGGARRARSTAPGSAIPQSAGGAGPTTRPAVLDVNLLGPWRVTVGGAAAAARGARSGRSTSPPGSRTSTVPFATAYCMSKRGLVAYSDALRIEHGDAITVTTVYPRLHPHADP